MKVKPAFVVAFAAVLERVQAFALFGIAVLGTGPLDLVKSDLCVAPVCQDEPLRERLFASMF
jgi:hypothetical protein